MKRSRQPSSTQSDQSSHMRSQIFIDLLRTSSSQTIMRAAISVAVAWVPLAILSALRGGASARSFLTDYASQSRFLIIIPVLILSEPLLHERIDSVAHHFETFLVPHNQLSKFHEDRTSGENMRDSKLARILIVLLTFATAAWLGQYLSPGCDEFAAWWKGGGGFRFFSPAGIWAMFVSYPILAYLTFLWLWRRLLWVQFLRSMTRLNLQLIASHPDRLGGLGFLEGALRGSFLSASAWELDGGRHRQSDPS